MHASGSPAITRNSVFAIRLGLLSVPDGRQGSIDWQCGNDFGKIGIPAAGHSSRGVGQLAFTLREQVESWRSYCREPRGAPRPTRSVAENGKESTEAASGEKTRGRLGKSTTRITPSGEEEGGPVGVPEAAASGDSFPARLPPPWAGTLSLVLL